MKKNPAMPKTVLKGRFSHKARGFAVLLRVTAGVLARRALGKPKVPQWSIAFETGTLFWRAQFEHAFSLPDIGQSRAYLDACYTLLDPHLDVETRPSGKQEPRGHWFIPKDMRHSATLLYFHGGGYAFYAEVSRHFIALLAHTLGVRIFAPDYRLSPENPHPAQLQDALAAYKYLLAQTAQPQNIVVGGDSAGGHLTLMLLLKLAQEQLPQPAMAIAISPWTDTGPRTFDNEAYDLLQSAQVMQFAQWFKGDAACSPADLSPMHQDFCGLSPLYIQAGDKELLAGMICDFARELDKQGARVCLDVWPHMTHEFQAYGRHLPESSQAMQRIGQALAWACASPTQADFPSIPHTQINTF